MKITRTSILSGTVNTMDLPITAEQLNKFENGALVQNVFPNLNDSEREFLISGITAAEWDKYVAWIARDEEDFLEDAQSDLVAYTGYLAEGNVDACLAIENKYGLCGLTPQMVSQELADMAAEFAELNKGEAEF